MNEEANLATATAPDVSDGADLPEVFLRRAGDNLADAVVATLRAGGPLRFAVAKRICDIGLVLQASTATRVDQVEHYAENGPMGAGVMMANPVVPGRFGMIANDQNEQLRQIMLVVDKIMNDRAVGDQTRAALEESRELAELQALRDKVSRDRAATIDARIKKLFENMEARNAGLVSADDPRGHLPDAGRGQADAPALLRDERGGEAGHGSVAHACRAQDVGPHAVAG